ncbi:MAG: hypothetical protein R3B82_21735 [Sandaracinaceae bacterium]
MRWWKSLWTREGPTLPVLLRVTDVDGVPPVVLDVESCWQPSGRRFERSLRTADGLTAIHWLGEQEEVELTVRSALGVARLRVPRAASRGRTFPIQLVAHAQGEPGAPNPRLVSGASAG